MLVTDVSLHKNRHFFASAHVWFNQPWDIKYLQRNAPLSDKLMHCSRSMTVSIDLYIKERIFTILCPDEALLFKETDGKYKVNASTWSTIEFSKKILFISDFRICCLPCLVILYLWNIDPFIWIGRKRGRKLSYCSKLGI